MCKESCIKMLMQPLFVTNLLAFVYVVNLVAIVMLDGDFFFTTRPVGEVFLFQAGNHVIFVKVSSVKYKMLKKG